MSGKNSVHLNSFLCTLIFARLQGSSNQRPSTLSINWTSITRTAKRNKNIFELPKFRAITIRVRVNIRSTQRAVLQKSCSTLQWVFCWENWFTFMLCWQDEIHLLGDYFKISLLNGHYQMDNFFSEPWKFSEIMDIHDEMYIIHVMQLAGKNISAIFLGVRNTF